MIYLNAVNNGKSIIDYNLIILLDKLNWCQPLLSHLSVQYCTHGRILNDHGPESIPFARRTGWSSLLRRTTNKYGLYYDINFTKIKQFYKIVYCKFIPKYIFAFLPSH